MAELDDLLDLIFKQYALRTSKALGENARNAYWAGQYAAGKGMGDRAVYGGMNADADAYAANYTKLLQEDGASVIQGKPVPWFRDSNEQQRKEVAEIIRKGIAEGKPTGVKERKKGGYTKDTIAADLNEYFDQRRSHASTVARSEVGRIKNQGMLDRYKGRRVEEVSVMDNEGPNSCEECHVANGQTWTVEKAQENELAHPNCVRAFRPLIRGFPR